MGAAFFLIDIISIVNGGFHSHGGTQTARWFIGKIPLKWMMIGGTPILGNHVWTSWGNSAKILAKSL